ncbi:MAG: DnaJ-class molecular chaperone with C-terminal Zn finger domain [Nitrospirae bacterium]|nr:DnaJ-class molecular chaperone with C-terminal Zn finger domain [Nitrospirota bacterium]
METIEKEVKKFDFPRILVDLHKKQKTGTLTVHTADVTKKVYLERGNAVFASSTDDDERLGETLIKLGKITIEQYDRSVELLKETGKRQGTILVELGYLTPKDLVLGVKSQVREIIYSLFLVEDAEYVFDEGELPTREVITLLMSMGNLIYEGIKRINNVVQIKREMPDMDSVLRLREDPESFFQDIVFSSRDKAILAAIDGTRTVKDIIDSSSATTFEAMKTLYVLYVAGFVEEQEKPGESDEHSMVSDEPVQALDTEEDAFDEKVNELYSNLYKLRPHDLLDIDENSDANMVQRNFYRLTKEFHPDQFSFSSDPLMLDKLIVISEEIQKAYMHLKEDDKRRDYFNSISDYSDEAVSEKCAEEHFRTELSKVSEDILFSRYVPGETEAQLMGNGESMPEAEDFQPPTEIDYTVEEQCEGSASQMNGEVPSSVKAYFEPDNEISRDDTDVQEGAAEASSVNKELEEPEPENAVQESHSEATIAFEQKGEMLERQTQFNGAEAGTGSESQMLLSGELSATGTQSHHEYSIQDPVNQELLSLVQEIKALLLELRKELPRPSGAQVAGAKEQGEEESTKEFPYGTGYEKIVLPEKTADLLQEVSREEHSAQPQGEIPEKKKLKLWHIVIAGLFLIAAAVSLVFVYTPEKQKIISQPAQPAQSEKAILPSVQKTQSVLPTPPPDVKKVSPVASSQAVQHTVELIATDSTWLSATIDEKSSKEMILKPGDQIKWTAKSNISLIIGNAEGLKVIFDGKDIGPLGGKGKVVRLKLPFSKNS